MNHANTRLNRADARANARENARENLGPAEKILQAVLTYTDHMVHNRPGMIVRDATHAVGVRWMPVAHRVENGEKVVYRLEKSGKKTIRRRVGVLQSDGRILEGAQGRTLAGTYRPAGLFAEVAAWMYRQVADVWRLDNEFAARWASYAYAQDHRDLKVVLAAFMLVQARRGDAVRDGDGNTGRVAFHDEDYRDVGEAMLLIRKPATREGAGASAKGGDLHPKLLLRVHDVLSLPAIAAINRELGFGCSARRPFFGRWHKAVEKWLRYREENPRLLEGLVKAGFKTTVVELARRVGYKPVTTRFFEVLRWKQNQSEDGRRTLAIGKEISAADAWEHLSEQAICERIVKTKPSWKVIVGQVPKYIGITRAIVACAIESAVLSSKDLIIATPTLEELGLLSVPTVRARWERAVAEAEDTRAANIALRVKSTATKETLQDAADTAVKKAVAEVTRDLRIYFMVDISGSMEGAIEKAKEYIAKFLQGFPLERLHVAVFNSHGRELRIPHASAAGVQNAFRGIVAGGGTHYGTGVWALQAHKPKPEEDTLFIFVGDEENSTPTFNGTVRDSGLRPMAFGLLRVLGTTSSGRGAAVRTTAKELGIPCFQIDERTFDDPYAIPRTIRALAAATPVSDTRVAGRAEPKRMSLVDTILKTDLLVKPAWAA